KGGGLNIGIWNINYPDYWMRSTTNNNTFTLGKWYYITISLDNGSTGAGIIKFYINGSLISKASGQMENSGAYDAILGNGNQNGASTPFEGYLSDIQIYNSTLSPSQIQVLYHEGIGGAPIKTYNLVDWWPLNGTLNSYRYITTSSYENNNVTTTVPSITQHTLLNFSPNT
ncbi:hypothetical protein B2A_08634, partial [mine drainage metagenome]